MRKVDDWRQFYSGDKCMNKDIKNERGNNNRKGLTRREFLKLTAAGAAGIAASTMFPSGISRALASGNMCF